MSELLYKEEVFQLVGLCMEIHRELGKDHDEVIYKDALVVELSGGFETARRSVGQFRWRRAGMEKSHFVDTNCRNCGSEDTNCTRIISEIRPDTNYTNYHQFI